MLNPDINIAKSKGIDLPLMKAYLGGRICGEHLNQCLKWRKAIREHFLNFKYDELKAEYKSFPISFLDPMNADDHSSIDLHGLQSNVSPNAIYDGDLLSLKTADVVIANLDDFFDDGIEKYLDIQIISDGDFGQLIEDIDFKEGFLKLRDKIINSRENIGTICEVGWTLLLNKPLILIVPEHRKYIYETHPFTRRASEIVTSVNELFDKKILETFYRRIASAKY